MRMRGIINDSDHQREEAEEVVNEVNKDHPVQRPGESRIIFYDETGPRT